MQKIIVLILFCLVYVQSFGQFLHADHKKAAELKHRPLIVALFDLEEEAETHCDSIHMEFYNKTIRELIPKHWALSDSIVFMRNTRVASIIKSGSHDYVILSAGSSLEGQQSSGDIFWYPSFTFMLFLSEDGMRFDASIIDRGYYRSPFMSDLEMTGQLFRGKYIFKMSFFKEALSENDLLFALKQFSLKISEAMKEKYPKGGIYAKKPDKKRTSLLKERVLLIPDDIDSAGINAGDIDRYYNHPYKLASQEEISRAIAAGEKGKAYIHYLWSDHVRMYQAFIIDTETGLVLNTFRPGQVNFNNEKCIPSGVSYRSRINFKLKHLKRL